MKHKFDYETCASHRCSRCLHNDACNAYAASDAHNADDIIIPCNKCIKGILKVEKLECYFEENEA